VRLREMASRRGLKINEYGVFREADSKRIGDGRRRTYTRPSGSLSYPPNCGRTPGRSRPPSKGAAGPGLPCGYPGGPPRPHEVVRRAHDLDDLVGAVRARKYGYVAITDHSKGLGVAHGLTEDRVREQMGVIDAANRKLKGFRILKGIEVDIRGDGTLDLPDTLLSELDHRVASIHSGFRQPGEQLTKRLVSAIRNPFVSIIAHPTGRLLGGARGIPRGHGDGDLGSGKVWQGAGNQRLSAATGPLRRLGPGGDAASHPAFGQHGHGHPEQPGLHGVRRLHRPPGVVGPGTC